MIVQAADYRVKLGIRNEIILAVEHFLKIFIILIVGSRFNVNKHAELVRRFKACLRRNNRVESDCVKPVLFCHENIFYVKAFFIKSAVILMLVRRASSDICAHIERKTVEVNVVFVRFKVPKTEFVTDMLLVFSAYERCFERIKHGALRRPHFCRKLRCDHNSPAAAESFSACRMLPVPASHAPCASLNYILRNNLRRKAVLRLSRRDF